MCEHGNDKDTCSEVCYDCDHECREHEESQCTGQVNDFYYGDAECDCEEFRTY